VEPSALVGARLGISLRIKAQSVLPLSLDLSRHRLAQDARNIDATVRSHGNTVHICFSG